MIPGSGLGMRRDCTAQFTPAAIKPATANTPTMPPTIPSTVPRSVSPTGSELSSALPLEASVPSSESPLKAAEESEVPPSERVALLVGTGLSPCATAGAIVPKVRAVATPRAVKVFLMRILKHALFAPAEH